MNILPVRPTENISLQELSFLWLEITSKCNLECVHCYADSSPRQDLFGYMDTNDWLAILSESATLGCKQVQFIGGEPTLHPNLTKMISFASGCGYSFIEVFTNLTVINESLLSTFIEHDVHIATSFYSDNPETHDSITKHSGSFNRTVEGIRRVVTAGLPIRIGIIEMLENAGHSLRAKRFLESIGVSEIKIDFQRGVGRAGKHIHSLEPLAELCGECWKGKLCVTSYGRVYPCVFSRFMDLGNARNGILSILEADTLFEFRAALKKYQRKAAGLEMHVCSPHLCPPTDSSCGPANFCTPETRTGPCSPDSKCAPSLGPCSPDRECGPTTRPCAPDRNR